MSLVVILVSPKTAGNVGSAARAMLNMGANELRLVAPRCEHLSSEAKAFAVHAQELLSQAQVYPTLREALADRDLSIGTSARGRGDLPPPQHPAHVRPLLRQAQRPALVFGPEETGLINSDLEQCQVIVRVPTADYASLNLAQAVLLVCYEFLQAEAPASNRSLPLLRASTAPDNADVAPTSKLASREEMEGLYDHLQEIMHLTGYTDAVRSQHILRLWRGMLDRTGMSSAESRMFRGLLRQVRWKVNNVGVQHPMHLRRAQERAQRAERQQKTDATQAAKPQEENQG